MPSAPAPAKIVVRDLVKRYGTVEAVRGVSFEVAAGTVCGLLGSNGAGKTTLLECLLGLRKPDGGSIWLDGIDALAEPERAKLRVGAALQSNALQDRITPREAVELFGAFYQDPLPANELLARFILTGKADAPFESLSSGQKQRLALALAFVHQPEILCLDEPTANLDVQARRELHGLICQLRAEGRTVFLTTHYVEEARALCDQVAVLDAGKIVASGRPQDLVSQSGVHPRLTLRTAFPLDLVALQRLPEIVAAETLDGATEIEAVQVGPAVAAVVRFLEMSGNELLDLSVSQPSLEDTLVELVGRSTPERIGTTASTEPARTTSPSRFPWRGWGRHLWLTLRLNFRSRQPLVYGYLVPAFFLLAFGSVFRSGTPPLLHEMGQLLTITILGGACFGMPTAIVAERERGVWRRYRLLPSPVTGVLLSTLVARFVLVLSAAAMQIVLAWALYHTPWPAQPMHLVGAFICASFAFLGLGLMIAMLAESVPAVQALGQLVFLPMIMIGGVGVPLRTLPPWAQQAAGFLPGRYAVEALDACIAPGGGGLAKAVFALAALGVIGAAAFGAAAGLFRWEIGPRSLSWRARGWVALALAAWGAVGCAAESPPTTHSTSAKMASAAHVIPRPSSLLPWRVLSEAELAKITYDDLPPDDGYVVPLATGYDGLGDDERARLGRIQDTLAYWTPGTVDDASQRVRNLLSVCALADLVMDPNEAEIARAVFDQIKDAVRDPFERRRVLAWIVLHPADGTVLTDASEFGIGQGPIEPLVRERAAAYARKFLRELRT